MGVDHRAEQIVLGLEVVVHVTERHAGRLRDIGERGGLHSMAVQEIGGTGGEARALAAAIVDL